PWARKLAADPADRSPESDICVVAAATGRACIAAGAPPSVDNTGMNRMNRMCQDARSHRRPWRLPTWLALAAIYGCGGGGGGGDIGPPPPPPPPPPPLTTGPAACEA